VIGGARGNVVSTTEDQQGFDVVVVGSINMDFVAFASRLPGRGETITGRSFTASPGGKGANQAVAASRLGARTALLGCVGGDPIGSTLLDALAGNGVACAAVKVAETTTSGVAMIVVDDNGANTIVVVPGGNGLLTDRDVLAHEALIRQSRVVALQLEIPMDVTMVAAQVARRCGKTVVLNPAPAQALPASLMSAVDYLIPNESEAADLTGIPVTDAASAAKAAAALRQAGAARVLVTLGDQGVVACTEAGTAHYPARATRAVDTTGAGDTFIGGLCCGLAAGLDLASAIEFGQAAAAISVTRLGAQQSIPFRAEVVV
jgi:ribokinase